MSFERPNSEKSLERAHDTASQIDSILITPGRALGTLELKQAILFMGLNTRETLIRAAKLAEKEAPLTPSALGGE